MSKAAEDALDALHGALATQMKDMLEAEGPKDAAFLNAVRQFLKDNGISSVLNDKPNNPTDELVDRLRGYEDSVEGSHPQHKH